MEGVELVAGADPYPSQREAFARKWGVEPGHVYADYREMLERERPDVVSVCTSARPRAAITADVVRTAAGAARRRERGQGGLGGEADGDLPGRGGCDG